MIYVQKNSREENLVKTGKEKIIIPYDIKLTVIAACFAFAAFVMLIVSFAVKTIILALLSLSFLLSGAFFMIQNKKIVLCGKDIKVRHFLGIIKDRTFTPVECGFFISEKTSAAHKPLYIDKRMLHGDMPEDCVRYIYLSEYILSKQEQEGSQYIYGEPVLILRYSHEMYTSLCDTFTFNCKEFE